MNSWFWIATIVIGGALVVIGNIQYARTYAVEQSVKVAKSAKEILEPELLANHQLAGKMLLALNADELTYQRLSTGAWQIVSHGGMIKSLPEKEINQITKSYQHAINATDHQDKLIELVSGSASALTRAPENRRIVISNLQYELNQLIEVTQPLLEEKKARHDNKQQ